MHSESLFFTDFNVSTMYRLHLDFSIHTDGVSAHLDEKKLVKDLKVRKQGRHGRGTYGEGRPVEDDLDGTVCIVSSCLTVSHPLTDQISHAGCV